MSRQFFGKYRGKVTANKDNDAMGRIKVEVPSVLGEGKNSWAMPAVPYAGKGVGLFTVPPIGANVWIEFESGDPDYPIWSGCFWAPGEVPAEPAEEHVKILKTENITLELNDKEGVKLEVRSPAAQTTLKLTMDKSGIELSIGSSTVKLTQTSVSVNNGALEVT